MKGARIQSVCLAVTAVLVLCSGCLGPRYSEHDMVVTGKRAPKIQGPRDPALQGNLSVKPWPRQPFLGRAAEVGTTLFKDAGIQGWKDYHMNAQATGVVLQHQFSTGPYLALDLRLRSLKVRGVPVPLPGPRYLRVVVFLARASVAPDVYKRTNSLVVARGKLVWNFDGWFEIHPQKTGDVLAGPAMGNGHLDGKWTAEPGALKATETANVHDTRAVLDN